MADPSHHQAARAWLDERESEQCDAKASSLLEDCLRRWELTDPVSLAHTPTSSVYHVRTSDGTAAVLKCLTKAGIQDEAPGGDLLNWYDGLGAVPLIRQVRDAHLLEAADGGSLGQLILQDRDDEATDVICSVVRELHRPRSQAVPPSLIPLRTRFRALFDAARDDRASHLVREAAELADELLASQTAMVPLHGDLHHENICFSFEREKWLAIDPKGLFGDPAYEVANVFLNPVGMPNVVQREGRPRMLAKRFAHSLDVPPQRILQFASTHAVLSALWSVEDGDDPTLGFRMAQRLWQELDGESRPQRSVRARLTGGMP